MLLSFRRGSAANSGYRTATFTVDPLHVSICKWLTFRYGPRPRHPATAPEPEIADKAVSCAIAGMPAITHKCSKPGRGPGSRANMYLLQSGPANRRKQVRCRTKSTYRHERRRLPPCAKTGPIFSRSFRTGLLAPSIVVAQSSVLAFPGRSSLSPCPLFSLSAVVPALPIRYKAA